MSVIPVTSDTVHQLKTALRGALPHVKSGHLTEAIANGLGHGSHAALLAALESDAGPRLAKVDSIRFGVRLSELGYPNVPLPDFDGISTWIISSLAPAAAAVLRARHPWGVLGWWSRVLSEAPTRRPAFDPHGGLFLEQQLFVDECGFALSLVPIDGEMRVLSEKAIFTYDHTKGLYNGEQRTFVTFDAQERREVYSIDASLAYIDPSDVLKRFRELAFAASRHNARAIVLSVKRTA